MIRWLDVPARHRLARASDLAQRAALALVALAVLAALASGAAEAIRTLAHLLGAA